MVMRVALRISVVAALAVGCKQKPPPAPAPAAPPLPAATTTPAAAAPVAAPAAAPADDPCPTICARTRPLKCKRADACPETCREMLRLEACGSEMAAVLSCFARQPLAAWECGEEGDATVKDGFCDKPQAQFSGCIEHGGAPRPGARQL